MKTIVRSIIALTAIALIPLGLGTARAQTSWQKDFTGGDGQSPPAGMVLSGNTLYGVTEYGGTFGFGTVFKINTDGSGYSVLKHFTGGSSSRYPAAGLTLAGATLYGTTREGGTVGFGFGTIFKINTDGTGFAVLKSFALDDGFFPKAEMTVAGSTLFGALYNGGNNSSIGALFKINTNGTGFSIIKHFNGSDGRHPIGRLAVSGETLFGITERGGTFGYENGNIGAGTMFKINTNGTGFAVIKHFGDVDGAAYPMGGLLMSGNALYGAVSRQVTDAGALFKINTDGTGYTVVRHFGFDTNGFHPNGELTLSGTTLYGTAQDEHGVFGRYGTVFRVNTDGTGYEVLKTFIGVPSDGVRPWGGLILSGAKLYGTTSGGGSSNNGTVFQITVAGPPEITADPESQAVVLGQDATFTVSATGEEILNYQWMFDGVEIFSATNSSYTRTNVQTDHVGSYTVSVSNSFGSVTSAAAMLTLASGAQFFYDPLDADTSSDWIINTSSADNRYTFGFDYSAIGVPQLPGSSSTRALKLEANLSAGAIAAINLSPRNQNFEGDHQLRFNLWLNFVGPMPGGGTGSTEAFTAGVGTTGDHVQWAQSGSAADGVWFSANGSGGWAAANVPYCDYGAYTGGSLVSTNTRAYAAGVSGTARDNFDPYYSFKFPATAAPAAQTAMYPSQTGNTRVGSLGFTWHEVIVRKTGNVVKWLINGHEIASVTNGVLAGDNIFIGYIDPAASVAPAATNAIQCGLIANVRVELPPDSVPIPPTIVSNPASQTKNAGETATFSVAVSGTAPLRYQWRFNDEDISGATTNSYTRENVQPADAGNYSVIVTNTAGSVTSAVATLTLVLPPTILEQPESRTNALGTMATFSVAAAGTDPLSYQWQKNGVNLSDGGTFSGATTQILTNSSVQSSDAGSYSVVVTNVAGSVTSAVATLTVPVPPSITVQPQSQTVAVGGEASFLVEATGTTPLGYQWQKNGVDIPGESSSELTLSNVQLTDEGSYRVVITNSVGSVTSSVATLTVTVVTYLFYDDFESGLTRWLPWPGLNQNLLTWDAQQNVTPGGSRSARAWVSDPAAWNGYADFGASGDSLCATVWLYEDSNIGLNPSLPVTCMLALYGDGSGPNSLSDFIQLGVAPSFPGGSVTYGFRTKYNDVNSLGIVNTGIHRKAGWTKLSICVDSLAENGQVRFYIDDELVGSSFRSGANLRWVRLGNNSKTYENFWYDDVAITAVSVALVITAQPNHRTNAVGTEATFNVTTTGTSPLSYRWQKSGVDLVNGGNISGATSATLTLSNVQLSDMGGYGVIVTNMAGSVTSATAMLTVHGANAVTYNGNTSNGFGGAIGEGTLALSDDGTTIYATISRGPGDFNDALVIYVDSVEGGFKDTSEFGDSADDLRRAISGFDGGFNRSVLTFPADFSPDYAIALGPVAANFGGVWQLNTGGGGSLNYNNSVNLFPVGDNVSEAYHFSFDVRDIGLLPDCGCTIKLLGTYVSTTGYRSDEALPGNVEGEQGWNSFNGISFGTYRTDGGQTAPSIIQQPFSRTNYFGTMATFSVTAAGDTPFSYQWQKGQVDLVVGENISGVAAATLTLNNVQLGDMGDYRVIVTNSAGSVTSLVATLTVIVPPVISLQPENQMKIQGNTATFSVEASGISPLSYQWRKNGVDLIDAGNTFGATSSVLTLSNVQISDGGIFSVVVSQTSGSVTSALAVLAVHGTNAVIYSGNSSNGFGGSIGEGTLMLSDDGTTVSGTIMKGPGLFNNALVIFIDSVEGGFADTSEFADSGDDLRRAISGFDGGFNRSVLTFPTEFLPDYAIALGPQQHFGGLWQLTNGSGNSLNYSNTVNLVPLGDDSSEMYHFSFDLKDIGLLPNYGRTLKLLGTYISTSGYRSDEALPGNVEGEQGWNPFDGTGFVTYSTAGEQTVSLAASLDGIQVEPPVVTPGWGTLSGTYDPTARFIDITGTYQELTGFATGAHLHGAALPGTNAGIIMGLTTTGGRAGMFSGSAILTESQATALLDGLLYVDIHTTFHPGGEIRGQLSITQPDTTSPQVACPANMTVQATASAGAEVIFEVTATDDTDPSPTVDVNPPSGSTFPIGATTVNVTASDASGNEGTCSFIVTVEAVPPSITAQPESQTLATGDTAVFNVEASGTPPLSYQWQKGGVVLTNGGDLSGATSSTLVLNNVQALDQGDYSVVVSNSAGIAPSSEATLTVYSPDDEWQRSFGGSGFDQLNAIQQTSDGGYIIGGHATSGVSGNKTSANYGSEDYWMIKLDARGDEIWQNSFGGDNRDYLESIQQTSDDGYILGGRSLSGISGNKTSDNYGGYDFWVVKLDATGTKIWENSFGGSSYDQLSSIQQTSDGGYILGGSSLSGVSGNKTSANNGDIDYWVVKLDASGTKVWENSFGGSGADELSVLRQTSDGGYILGGRSSSGISGNKTSANFGSFDYWVVKLDANGSKLWDKSFGCSGLDDLTALQQTSDGGYILGGSSSSGILGNKTSASYGNQSGNSDYWVIKLDADGAKLWENSFGGSNPDRLETLQQTSDGGYILGGYSYAGISGNKISPNHGGGGADYWIVKLDASGTKIWENSYGGTSEDRLFSLQQVNGNGYILGGYSASSISGNKTTVNYGSADYWGLKLANPIVPLIISQPESQTHVFGSVVTLSVTANNALGYQWRRNGNIVIGATSSSLVIEDFQPHNVGCFDVILTGSGGNVASANAYLFPSGIGIETNRPIVTIISPTTNQRITNNLTTAIYGTAKDVGGLGVWKVFYKLNGGSFELANGTTNWLAPLTLIPGTNKVEVKAVDFGGNESTVLSRSFFAVIPSLFTLATNGFGKITITQSTIGTPTNGAMLEVGRPYKIQAVPAANNVFSNWTGSVTYTNALFTFVMQPNMTLTANFVPNPMLNTAGRYNGLFHGANVTHQTAGFFTMNVNTNFAFSGLLIFDGDAISLSGKFNVDGTFTKTFSRAIKGKGDVTLSLALDLANGTDKATGTVSTADWIADLQADRATFSAANPATAYTNQYTMLLPGFADPADGPPGYGYGALIIKTNGDVTLTGATADGQTLSQSAPVSKNGEWPLYVQMYQSVRVYTNLLKNVLATNNSYSLGSALGWVIFTNNAPTGRVSWIKTSWTNSVYPDGFTNETVVLGSRYLAPAKGNRAIDIINGTVTLTNGNLTAALTRDVLIKTNNAVVITPTNQTVKLTLTASKGLLSGSFKHPDNTNKVTTIRGAVLQDQNFGGGFFVGTNQGGLMSLEEEN